jgi:hypothetical protein
MKGGLCPVHKTELTGFGNLVFCKECEAEIDIKDTDNVNPTTLAKGYIISLFKIKYGILTLCPSDNIWLKKPDLAGTKGFIYKFSLDYLDYNLTADGKMAYVTDIYQGVRVEEED